MLYYCSRWSRREEADFYRTVSTFGVEYNRAAGRYRWDRFRCFARLDKKYDDTLVEYFQAFYHMCQRVCGKFKTAEEGNLLHVCFSFYVRSRCTSHQIEKVNKKLLVMVYLIEIMSILMLSIHLTDRELNKLLVMAYVIDTMSILMLSIHLTGRELNKKLLVIVYLI